MSESKLRECEGEIEKLTSEINAKNKELNQLLESVKAVCCKVGSTNTSQCCFSDYMSMYRTLVPTVPGLP